MPDGTLIKNPPASVGDARDEGSSPELGRSPGGGNGNPLQYSCLENSMDRRTWWVRIHGVGKSQTWLSTLKSKEGNDKYWQARGKIRSFIPWTDKTWSTGEGNGKPLQYSCLENPMNSMKQQKHRTLKDKLTRSVDAQYAIGEIAPERMKRLNQSENPMEVKPNAIKNNIA